MKATAVMTRDVAVVSPVVSVGGATHMMERLKVRHLPVVEGHRLVGILSTATCSNAAALLPVERR